MAQNDAGMFESLGLNPVEDPQQREMHRRRMSQSGQRSGQALGGLWNAVATKLQGGKFRPGEEIDRHEKDLKAQRMGLSGIGELNDIERIKDATARQDFGDTRTTESRIKMAQFVAEQARGSGNMAVRAKAMAQVQALRQELREERKMKAQNERAEAEADRAGALAHEAATPDIWLRGETNARAAQRAEWRDDNGKPVVGMEYYDENGELQRVPVGQYSTQDPALAASRSRTGAGGVGRPETIGQAWGRNTSPQDYRKINDMVTTSLQASRIMGRVMDTIEDVTTQGRGSGVMGKAGEWTVSIDQATRALNSVGNTVQRSFPMLAAGMGKDDTPQTERQNKDGSMGTWSGREYWTGADGVASDINHPVWDVVKLPEEMRGDSALAQNYRAQLMELMYMTARLAEPSNRGLSDNDIINAARRLGGDTSNPAVMMGRFAEMMYDSVADIEAHLDTWYGAVEFENYVVPEGMTKREQYERFVGGGQVETIRDNLKALSEKHDFTVDPETGRATFASPLDDFVNPYETEALSKGPTREAAEILDRQDQSDEDFLGDF